MGVTSLLVTSNILLGSAKVMDSRSIILHSLFCLHRKRKKYKIKKKKGGGRGRGERFLAQNISSLLLVEDKAPDQMLSTVSLTITGGDLEKRKFVPWSHPCLSRNQPPCDCQGAGPLPACFLTSTVGAATLQPLGLLCLVVPWLQHTSRPLAALCCCCKQAAAKYDSHLIIHIRCGTYCLQGPLC